MITKFDFRENLVYNQMVNHIIYTFVIQMRKYIVRFPSIFYFPGILDFSEKLPVRDRLLIIFFFYDGCNGGTF